MARVCICSGSSSGPCVTVVDGTASGTPAAGYFFPADHTGNVGDTWNGSSWDRLAGPSAESEWDTGWDADHDTGALRARVAGAEVGRLLAGVSLDGLSAALTGAFAGRRTIGVDGDATGLAIVGFGADAAHAPGLVLARSAGSKPTLTPLDGSYVLGRLRWMGAVYGGAPGEAGRLELIRTGGGVADGAALYGRLRFMMMSAAGELAEVASLTHEGRLGVGTTAPGAALEARAASGTASFVAGVAGGGVHVTVDADGRALFGHASSVEIAEAEPVVQVTTADVAMRLGRWAADAAGASLHLYKSRGTTPRATDDVTESEVALEGDEVGEVVFLAPSAQATVATYARLVGVRGETGADGEIAFEASGAAGLERVARITAGGLGVGLGADPVEAPLHGRSTVTSTTGVGLAAVFESLVDVVAPEASDDPDVGQGVAVHLRAAKVSGGSVLAAYVQTRAVDVSEDAEVHDLRIYTRSAGAAALAAEFGDGQIRAEVGSAALPSIAFRLSPTTGLFRPAAGQLAVALGGAEAARLAATYLRPATDNALTLGQAALRWSTIYAATGTINTSDVREKFDLGAFPLGLDFIAALQPRWFRWLDGSRRHAGLYAQDVAAALSAAGIDPATAGMWTLADPADPESRQGLRMDQFTPPLIRAVQQLAARVAALEAA
jgi:hypothetical protein